MVLFIGCITTAQCEEDKMNACKIEEKDQGPSRLRASDPWGLGERVPCPLSRESAETGVPVTLAEGLTRWPLRPESTRHSLVSVARQVLTTQQRQEHTKRGAGDVRLAFLSPQHGSQSVSQTWRLWGTRPLEGPVFQEILTFQPPLRSLVEECLCPKSPLETCLHI